MTHPATVDRQQGDNVSGKTGERMDTPKGVIMDTYGKLNEAVKAKLEGAGINTDPAELMETLLDAKTIYSEITGEHRWYEDEFRVVEIRGVLIGYDYYHVTGDTSISDMDLDFDISAVCIAERYEKTEVSYRPANIE